MLDSFLKANRLTISLVFLILFAVLVYPTPYEYWNNYQDKSKDSFRRNRITGTIENWYPGIGGGSWARWGTDAYLSHRRGQKDKIESAGMPLND